MAGLAKPDIENLKKEGKINFLEYNNFNLYDTMESLIDGDINSKTKYGLLLFEECPVLKFELLQDSNIYAYGKRYYDSGGMSPKPVKIYKEIGGQFEYLKTVPTSAEKWYLLCDNLEKGIYKFEYTSRYANFTEFYIESLEMRKYFIIQNNKYYTIKPEYYDSITKKFNSLTLVNPTSSKEEIESLGFDDLSILTNEMIVGEDTFRPIDILENEFEIKLYTDKS